MKASAEKAMLGHEQPLVVDRTSNSTEIPNSSKSNEVVTTDVGCN